MKMKNKFIITLILLAVILFCSICFIIIPSFERKQADCESRQLDAVTHDISVIEDYRSPYVGDASNISSLFENLPLGNIGKKYEIDSDKCTLTVSYLDTISNIGESKVQQDLIYNTAAAMAAIDNLSAVTYEFSGDNFRFTREQIQKAFGDDLSSLLNDKVWEEKVQNKISDDAFLKQFYKETE